MLSPTAMATATPGRREPSLYPLLDQRPLELRQRAEDVEQEFTLWRRGVHLFGQGTEADAASPEVGDCGEEVRQRSTETVQLPDNQAIAGSGKSKRLGQTGTITAAAADPILEQVTLIDAGGQQSITLQVQNLTVTVGRDAHVADQHVRKTLSKNTAVSASASVNVSLRSSF